MSVEEIFRVSNKVASLETGYDHIIKQITELELLMKEHSLKAELSQNDSKKEIQSIKDLLNQVQGAYKFGAFIMSLLGIQGVIIIIKMMEWI